MALLICCLASLAGVRAEDVTTSGAVGRGECPTWSWSEQEQPPIFDPLYSPDSAPSRDRVRQLGERLKAETEEGFRKRGWTQAASGGACQAAYSLIQALDLDVARHGSGGMVPGNLGGAGGSFGAGKTDSYLRKRGTFVLEISSGDPAKRLWRGSLRGSLGQGDEVEKNSVKLAREVIKTLPRQ